MNAKWNAKYFFPVLFLAFFPPHLLFADNVPQVGTLNELINALIEVESGGDDGAIGDRHLKHMAYGCLQIRKPCVDDVNRVHGTDYRSEDCLYNRELSVWICERYIALYATEKRLGRKPTDEDRARIWNGGPNGYKKKSTENYWLKVKKQMKESLRNRPQEESRIG